MVEWLPGSRWHWAWAAALIAILGLTTAVIALERTGPKNATRTSQSSEVGAEVADAVSSRVFDVGRPYGLARVTPLRFAWPVRPFDQPHTLRATFGEPRGILDSGLQLRGRALAQTLSRLDQLLPLGQRLLHTGVDIVAADGTPVYAVESGVAHTGGASWDQYTIIGHFGYWHLDAPVTSGTQVLAFTTVIGRVYPGQGHVHLTRFAGAGATPVNPLLGGGLTPYTDTAPPSLDELRAFDPSGRVIPLRQLHGPVVLSLRAADVQSTGATHTGLYRLEYRIEPSGGGTPVVGPTETFRFDALPTGAVTDVIYTLGSTRHRFETIFWYRFSDRSPTEDGLIHTERFTPGDYRIIVTGSDARGNKSERAFPVRVIASK